MNSLFQNMGNQPGMQQGGNRISAQQVIGLIRNSGKTPEQIVRGMIDNGMLSQEQFEQYRAIANRTLGTNL